MMAGDARFPDRHPGAGPRWRTDRLGDRRRDDAERRQPAPLEQADANARHHAGGGPRSARDVDDDGGEVAPPRDIMVKLTRIYTRGGDKGKTSLGDGTRVLKQSLRVEAFGTVDEANAAIGLARLHAEGEADQMLTRIQNDLFDLGADLCTPEGGRRGAGALRIVAAQVKRLETEIDAINAALAPLNSFVLPGGSPA